ncbi:MAG: hypothetical protein JRE23_10830 [Deltaproteobacteria bacterium]|nr:hypothetical protein [Deltaproteobacteria bacterium]
MQKTILLPLFIIIILLPAYNGYSHAEQQHNYLFSTSLHKTGEGMRYWYEAKDGFKTLTGIPYDKLGCKQCHVKGCDDCHLKETKKGQNLLVGNGQKNEICFKCHVRAKAVANLGKRQNSLDVHMEAGMTCIDCHTSREIHGDGNFYKTMRDPNAKDAACVNCHTKNSEDCPSLPATKSHTVHNDKVDCNACHVRNTLTCYNCHFGEFAKTKSKPKSFVGKINDFLLLVKYKGKITSGNLQTLVSSENKPFIVYVPYLTHSIMSDGRKCEECHGTEAVSAIASGKRFTMATYKNDKINFYKGIVPLAPDLLEWPFFRKEGGKWLPFEPKQKPLIQMGLYAQPFTRDELKKLNIKQRYEK